MSTKAGTRRTTTDHPDSGKDLPYAIYARLSKAATGDFEKVEYQIDMCSKYAANRGLAVADDQVYSDNSLSAWKKGVQRPGWDRLMKAAESGQIAGILVWAVDRFTRRPKDLETLIELADDHALAIEGPRSGRLDLTTATGRQQARWMALQAASESDNTSERVKATLGRKLRSGQPMGTRAFGFETNGRVQRPEEVKILRDLGARLIAGETLQSMVEWLNDQGITTTRGMKWQHGSHLGRVLGKPRYGGWVVHGDEWVSKITNLDGSPQEPVFDQETFDAIQAILSSRRRGRRPTSTFWLTGVFTCADCGVRMSGGHVNGKKSRQRMYRCHPALGGCAKMVDADLAEAKVSEFMVELLSDPENVAKIAAEDAALNDARAERQSKLDEIENQLVDLEVKKASGEIIAAAYDRAKPILDRRRNELIAGLGELAPEVAMIGYDAAGDWDSMEAEERRQTIRRYRVSITMDPKLGVNRMDPERVVIAEC